MTRHTTRQFRRQITTAAGATLVATLLAACSSASPDTPPAGPSTPTTRPASVTPAPSPAAAHSNVAVTLKDFGVAATPASVPAGHVTFVVQNTGVTPHELVVVKSDLAVDQLPQVNQKLVDVKQVQVVGDTEPFDGGTKRELTMELAPGRYVLLCNVASHYVSGMFASFNVTVAR